MKRWRNIQRARHYKRADDEPRRKPVSLTKREPMATLITKALDQLLEDFVPAMTTHTNSHGDNDHVA